MTADEEDEYHIAQANAPIDAKTGRFVKATGADAATAATIPRVPPEEVDSWTFRPSSWSSVSAALIPFLEHDDANRALMGSNMQRQAVPLLHTERRRSSARASSARRRWTRASASLASNGGEVDRVDAPTRSSSATNWAARDHYKLRKFQRSNQNTCINQKPIVNAGREGRSRATCWPTGRPPTTASWPWARNVLVAFMPWGGYNFEDAILLSERLVKDDVFTSIHIEEFEIDARDTKLGKEEITRDIPNVSEDALAKLDEERPGLHRRRSRARRHPGRQGHAQGRDRADQRGEAAARHLRREGRRRARRLPEGAPGHRRHVIDIKVFSRKERGTRTDRQDKQKIAAARTRNATTAWRPCGRDFDQELKELLAGHRPRRSTTSRPARPILKPGGTDRPGGHRVRAPLACAPACCRWTAPRACEIKRLYQRTVAQRERDRRSDQQQDRPDQDRRRAAPGRHQAGQGLPGHQAQDLGRRQDGRPPRQQGRDRQDPARGGHAVPGRRHAGGHRAQPAGRAHPHERRPDPGDPPGLGRARRWASSVATPVFDGADGGPDQATGCDEAGLPENGQTMLYDGLTGEPFDRQVTVGVIYMMKLAHLVDDKMHARSIGPYSLVTQQPLGGKAQFGGQRFGEMEVWALEAYGAAHTLQELLTVKSDDVQGRTRIYEAIVKGQNALAAGRPRVLQRAGQGAAGPVPEHGAAQHQGPGRGADGARGGGGRGRRAAADGSAWRRGRRERAGRRSRRKRRRERGCGA